MSTTLEIKIDENQFKAIEKELGNLKYLAPKVAAGAINKTVAKGRTRIARRVASELGVSTRRVGNKVRAFKTNVRELVGKIRLYPFRIPMIFTKKTPTLGGLYALGQTEDPVVIQHTPFQQTMLSGHKGWFVRVDPKRTMQKGHYAGKVREPVKQIYSESPESLWRNAPGMASEELEAVADELEKQVASQLDRFLK